MTKEQDQGWSDAFGDGVTLLDRFAMCASEKDIEAHSRHEVTSSITDLHGTARKMVSVTTRTREQARYAFAAAMVEARGQV